MLPDVMQSPKATYPMAGLGRQKVAPEADPRIETSVAASAAPRPSRLFDQSLPNLLHLESGLHQIDTDIGLCTEGEREGEGGGGGGGS